MKVFCVEWRGFFGTSRNGENVKEKVIDVVIGFRKRVRSAMKDIFNRQWV